MACEWRFTWFQNNSMKANPDRFHLLLTDTDWQRMEKCNEKIENSCCEKLLGMKIDSKLKFKEHVETLCKKASQNINALARISFYMTFQHRKLKLNSFVISHVSYCSIVWMFHSRRLNNRIITHAREPYKLFTKITHLSLIY